MNCRSKSSPTARQKQKKNVCWHFIWDYDEYIHYLVENHLSYPFLSFSCFIAIAKSLQSCPTLCNPIDGSPPGFPIPGILQARTPEWAAISFSNVWKWKVKVKLLSRVRLSVTLWTAAFQAPPSMGFSRQKYWSGVPLYKRQVLYIVFGLIFFHLNIIWLISFHVVAVFFIFLTPVWLLHYWVCQTNLDFRLGLVLGFHLFIEVYLVC